MKHVTQKDKCKSGFTLVELSIVLVILGLLVGGILVGRDLIHASEIRALITQRDKFEAAANTFKLKFGCLPGDCANASALGVGDPTPGNYGEDGDGDGIIDNGFNVSGVKDYEALNFWFHLSKSGLIEWSPTSGIAYPSGDYSCNLQGDNNSPCLAFAAWSNGINFGSVPGGWWVLSTQDQNLGFIPKFGALHFWWLTGVVGAGGNDSSAVFAPADAYAIDNKIDDALPLSGTVRAAGDDNNDPYGPFVPTIGNGGVNSDTCVNDLTSPNSYNVKNFNRTAANLCSLVIKASF